MHIYTKRVSIDNVQYSSLNQIDKQTYHENLKCNSDLIQSDPLRLQGQAAICDIHVTNIIIYTVSRTVTNNATLCEQHKILIN